MTRILLILSLVLVVVSAWFIYSQGILGQVLNPTVIALRAENDVAASQRIRPNMVVSRDVPVSLLARRRRRSTTKGISPQRPDSVFLPPPPNSTLPPML